MTARHLLSLLGGIAQFLGVAMVVRGLWSDRKDARAILEQPPLQEDFHADWTEVPLELRQTVADLEAIRRRLSDHFEQGVKTQGVGTVLVFIGIALATAGALA